MDLTRHSLWKQESAGAECGRGYPENYKVNDANLPWIPLAGGLIQVLRHWL